MRDDDNTEIPPLSDLLGCLIQTTEKLRSKSIVVPQSIWDEWAATYGQENLERGIEVELAPKGITVKVKTDEEVYMAVRPAGEA